MPDQNRTIVVDLDSGKPVEYDSADLSSAIVPCSSCHCQVRVPYERLNAPENRCPRCDTPLTQVRQTQSGARTEKVQLTSTGAATIFLTSNMFREGDVLDKYRTVSSLAKAAWQKCIWRNMSCFKKNTPSK